MLFEQPMLCPTCVDSSGRLHPVQDCTICRGTWVVVPDWRHLGGVFAVVGLLSVSAVIAFLLCGTA
jgi:hypothetical protein